MRKLGPIVIIDDDIEDLEIINYALKTLKVVNEILVFSSGRDFITYLEENNGALFFILCDINMPQMNGYELFKYLKADPALSKVCFPFILFSTSWNSNEVIKAYELPIQGYLKKPSTFAGIVKTLENIIAYWDNCFNPIISIDYQPGQGTPVKSLPENILTTGS